MAETPRVEPIAEHNLPAFIAALEERYAQQKVEFGLLDPEQAGEQARAEVASFFPGGRPMESHAIFQVRADSAASSAGDSAGESPAGPALGSVWVAPHRVEAGLAFIYDIVVAESARGQGLGRALLRVSVDWATSGGFTAIGLHVFGGNTGAIRLYESEGFTVTDVLMRRSL